MEKFAIGLIIGGIGGALLVANNYKMRTLVKKGQEEVQAKFDQLMDEKIEAMEKGAEDIKNEVKEKAKELKDDAEQAIKKKTRSLRKKTEPTAN